MKQILFCLLIACVPSLSFARYEGVCREPVADGFDVQHSRALEVFRSLGVPEKVHDFENTVVYVEAYPKIVDPKNSLYFFRHLFYSKVTESESGLYYHSNFVTPGYDYSTKVAHPTNDIQAVLENIFFLERSSGIERTRFLSALQNDVVFVFHIEVLHSSATPLNLGPIRKFYVVDSKGNRVKVKREKEEEQYRCSFDNPCWDKEKNQLAELCDSETTHPTISLLNALVQGAISGFQCSIEGIAKQ